MLSGEPALGAPARVSQNSCPNGTESQSPGLAALFAAYPGNKPLNRIYPERVVNTWDSNTTPSGLIFVLHFPRVGCERRSQPWALRHYPFGVVLRRPRRLAGGLRAGSGSFRNGGEHLHPVRRRERPPQYWWHDRRGALILSRLKDSQCPDEPCLEPPP